MAASATRGVTAAAAGLSGLVLMLVLTFFFARDGASLFEPALRLLPESRRTVGRRAAEEGWNTLGRWMRGTVLVALVDAIGIGVGLIFLRVPLALSLALLTFVSAFVPVVGAIAAGLLAVLVAWASLGTKAALFTLALVVGVQQLEGNVLQPIIMGRVLPLHPAAVLLAVTAGALLGGIPGALMAVPSAAAVTAAAKAWVSNTADR